MTQDDAKNPRSLSLAVAADHPRAGAEVDLSFVARGRLHTTHWQLTCFPQTSQETADTGIASGKALFLVPQVLIDALSVESLLQLAENQLAKRLALTRRSRTYPVIGFGRYRARCLDVLGDRLTMDAE